MDLDEIADLLDVAVSTDDEGEARTVFSIAIDKIDSTIGEWVANSAAVNSNCSSGRSSTG